MPIRKTEEFEVDFLERSKRIIAANLTAKGQSASANERLDALANKISTIDTGKKFATGSVLKTTNPKLVVSGIGFTPRVVFVYFTFNNEVYRYVWHKDRDAQNSSPEYMSNIGVSINPNLSGSLSTFYQYSPGLIGTANGFEFQVSYVNINVTWEAYT